MPATNMSGIGIKNQVSYPVNPSVGSTVVMDPLSGPKGSPFDKDSAGNCSTGGLSTGIGFCANDIFKPNATFTTNPAAITGAGFQDDYVPGAVTNGATPTPPLGAMIYIGGGRSVITNDKSVTTPYTAGTHLCQFGNGGSRDAGGASPFTGFPMKTVTAVGTVAQGGVVEAGWTNRSDRTIVITESVFGSSIAAEPLPS